MTDKQMFLEMQAPVHYSDLVPGMYAINCSDSFDSEVINSCIQCAVDSEDFSFFNNTFVGIMLPYYLHNANNLMVGVLGNLDLAGMLVPNMKKVEPKIVLARAATGNVVDYLRSIGEAISFTDSSPLTGDAIKKCMTLLEAACGRSVSFDVVENVETGGSFIYNDSPKAVAAFSGMAAWVIVSLAGTGAVTGSISHERLKLKWSRPADVGVPCMPGRDSRYSILGVTGGLAVAAGMAFVVENWTDNGGEVSLVIKR